MIAIAQRHVASYKPTQAPKRLQRRLPQGNAPQLRSFQLESSTQTQKRRIKQALGREILAANSHRHFYQSQGEQARCSPQPDQAPDSCCFATAIAQIKIRVGFSNCRASDRTRVQLCRNSARIRAVVGRSRGIKWEFVRKYIMKAAPRQET